MKATRVASYEEAVAHGPGAFWYHFDEDGNPTQISFIVPTSVKDSDGNWRAPGQHGCLSGGNFVPGGWGFDGNLDCPTVEGSFWSNTPNGWHGYLRGGEFVDA